MYSTESETYNVAQFGDIPYCSVCKNYHFGICPYNIIPDVRINYNYADQELKNLLKEILEELRGLRALITKQSSDDQ